MSCLLLVHCCRLFRVSRFMLLVCHVLFVPYCLSFIVSCVFGVIGCCNICVLFLVCWWLVVCFVVVVCEVLLCCLSILVSCLVL